MNEEERKQVNMLLNIVTIDNQLEIVQEIIKTMLSREQPTKLDIITIDEVIQLVYKRVKFLKKYDISYDKVKHLLKTYENEMKEEQIQALNKLIEEHEKNNRT